MSPGRGSGTMLLPTVGTPVIGRISAVGDRFPLWEDEARRRGGAGSGSRRVACRHKEATLSQRADER